MGDLNQVKEFALVTQMRAGTHFICYALRMALEATIYRPDRERRFIVMENDYILRGLHPTDDTALPAPRPDVKIYFNHYYHPQLQSLPGVRRIYLIGYPFDSFYSDGIVYSEKTYDVGPSGSRANGYMMRQSNSEWNFLRSYMVQNAEWLQEISEGKDAIILRYEDFFLDFKKCAARLSEFTGGFVRPLPKPVINAKRMYWTDSYSTCLDELALGALWTLFEPGIRRFYPEKIDPLQAALGSSAVAEPTQQPW
jgi:hypothetical protein